MRIGLIAQPHITGLGIQQFEFARHMKPSKVLLTDLSKIHAANSRNAKRVTNVDWFDQFNSRRCVGLPSKADTDWLLQDIDLLFVIETPLQWGIFQDARDRGVKSVLQYNHEFLEYFIRPSLPKPDLLLAPSKWYINEVEARGFAPVEYLPVPIATDRIKRRKITRARKFIHVVGHKAHLDRNGTEIVKGLRPFVTSIRSRIEVAVYDQSRRQLDNYWDLYAEGDVLLMTRRYGGLCLTIDQAAAAGMPVIVEPHDPYASEGCSVPVKGNCEVKTLKLRSNIASHNLHPQYLAKTMENLVNRGSIEDLSDKAYEWARARSWDNMQSIYQERFERLYASDE